MSQEGNDSGWRYPDEEQDAKEFAWTRLTPEPAARVDYAPPFEVFLIHVKTGPDTKYGFHANNDPISFFRRHIREMGLDGKEIHAQLLRINAEVPANAKWVSLLVTVASHSPTKVTILHYKQPPDEGQEGEEGAPAA